MRWWKRCQDFAHAHKVAFHKAHNFFHLSYFTLIVTHGPYHIAAGICLLCGVAAWLLHVELDE